MRRGLIAAAVMATGLFAAAPAHAESIFVSALTQSFAPAHLDVLTGDTVVWRNVSQKTHNVQFETEGWGSGRIAPRGAANHQFPVAGVYPYVCTIHDGMTGEVGVYPLVLSGPAQTRVRRGTSVALHVRAPEGAGEVRIEADSGSGFVPVSVAGPADGGGHEGHEEPGMLHATVVASETAIYRAVFSGGFSQELRIEATDAPDLVAKVRRAGRGVAVSVAGSPATPGARVVLQLKLRERFGWWPVARARLDGRSRARFAVRGHAGAPARVVLVGADWASPLTVSRVLKLPH